MLQLSLHSLVQQLVITRQAPADIAASPMPNEQAIGESMHSSATVVLDASYLNLNIFQVRPTLLTADHGRRTGTFATCDHETCSERDLLQSQVEHEWSRT